MNGNSSVFVKECEPARELHAKSIDGSLTVKIRNTEIDFVRVSE